MLAPPKNIYEENQLLKASVGYLKSELSKFKELPLLVCEIRKTIDNKAIIRVPNGNQFYVSLADSVSVQPGDTVLVEQKSLTVIQRLEQTKNYDVDAFLVIETPGISWEELGGLEEQIRELKEVVELPLQQPALFLKLGIQPPKGILLHGPPGTGKTLLAKAVATSTHATFIHVVASELVQKFIGEGAKLVKDLFQLAKEKAPSIIFIDEIDALAGQRLEAGTSGEREVQRTLIQLLTEMDGFTSLSNVKIIGATNRIDILDVALLRPGRFDRIIHVDLPNHEARKNILSVHTKKLNLQEFNVDVLIEQTEGFSGADLQALCTEAGYFALREQRDYIQTDDFLKAVEKLNEQDQEEPRPIELYG